MGLVEVPVAHRRLYRLPSDEALVEAMVVGHGLFAILPAQPHELAVDAAIKVHQSATRILEHGSHVFDFTPASSIGVDPLEQLALQDAHVWRVEIVDSDRLERSTHKLAELLEPPLDVS